MVVMTVWCNFFFFKLHQKAGGGVSVQGGASGGGAVNSWPAIGRAEPHVWCEADTRIVACRRSRHCN